MDDIRQAADALCESHPELAARLRAIKWGGASAPDHLVRLADQWEVIQRRVANGEDARAIITQFATRMIGDDRPLEEKEAYWWKIYKLRGRQDLRAELKRRGRI